MTPEREAQRILTITDGDLFKSLELLAGQLNVLQTRAQVLMSLAGVVITVTGFSGRLIAARDPIAQACIVGGVFLVLASAIYVFLRVMGLRWVTQGLEDEPATALTAVIRRRNARTQAYRIGGILLFLGFALYCTAVAILLLNPEPVNLPVR